MQRDRYGTKNTGKIKKADIKNIVKDKYKNKKQILKILQKIKIYINKYKKCNNIYYFGNNENIVR